jgi:hypothetical protein
MIAAAIAGAITLLALMSAFGKDQGLYALIQSQAEAFSSQNVPLFGTDAEQIVGNFFMVAFRGGALISAFFLLFFSRQMSFILARLLSRQRESSAGDLIGFYVPKNAIWVLILCLLLVVAFRIVPLAFIEVAAWNVLVICIVMYLAQGGGIVLFTLAHRPIPPAMRLPCGLLLIVLLFSFNLLALVLLVLLGIAENWLPLRVIKGNNTPAL